MGSIDHGPAPPDAVRAQVAETFRAESARVIASVLRIVRDIDLAQEVVQGAFEQALDHWPVSGVPDRPGAWLSTTARRRALDHLRRVRRAGARAEALAHHALGMMEPPPDVADPEEIPDDRLRLDLHVLPSGLARRQSRGPHPEAGGRALDGRDRAGIPRAGADHRAAARARQADDPRRAVPLRGAGGSRAVGAAVGGARGDVPDLQRGLRGVLRERPRATGSLRGGHPARPRARRADAGRAGGPRAARPDGAAGRAGRGAHRRRRQPRAARGPGPAPLGPGADRPRARRARARRSARAGRRVSAPGRHRRLSRAGRVVGSHRLDPDRRALPRARGGRPVAGGRAEPGGRDRAGARAGGRARGPRPDRRVRAAGLSSPAGRARRFPSPPRSLR